MMFFAYLLVMVATYFISQALAPKQEPPAAATLKDFQIPQADEGTPQAVFFGDNWSGDWMVLGVGNFRTTPVKAKSSKKG